MLKKKEDAVDTNSVDRQKSLEEKAERDKIIADRKLEQEAKKRL
jgi:hypothetical protein